MRPVATAAAVGATVTALALLGVFAATPPDDPSAATALADAQRSLEGARAARDLATLTAQLAAREAPSEGWQAVLARATATLPDDSAWSRVELLDAQGSVVATAVRAVRDARRRGCPDAVRTTPAHASAPAVVLSLTQRCEAPPTTPSRNGLGTGLLCALAAGAVAFVAMRRRDAAEGRRQAARAQRMQALAEAMAQVAAGARRVTLDPGEDGAEAELVRAFLRMVDELGLVQARVDTLQRLAAWQDFARRLAHEIKNPLTPIALAAQELSRRYTGDDAGFRRTLETATEVIAEEVATLRRLVTAFSEFARMPEVKPAPGDLGEFVRDMAGSRAFVEEAGGGAAGVTVHFDAPATPLPVRIDRIMLRRAVDNLVRNAVQALRGRGGTVWVRATSHDVTEADGAVVPQAWLVVEDDGPGIPAAERDRVFEPYFTTKPEGTGLGLAIVRKVCLDHDGDVGLEARPGGGARFVLTLPRVEPGAAGSRSQTRRSFVTFSRAGGDTSGVAPVAVAGTLPRHAATGDGAEARAGDGGDDGGGRVVRGGDGARDAP